MADRFFCESAISGRLALIAGPEAHHMIHVMRVKPGERVILFDGSGMEFTAEVRRVGRSEVELAVLSRQAIDRELPIGVILAVALPKGDRQRWLVEKAVELGVSRLVPLKTARCVAQPLERTLDRLQRTVVEASRQCGRNRLMEIGEPQNWVDFVGATAELGWRLLAHPNDGQTETRASHGVSFLSTLSTAGGADPVLLAIGPEGGFTSEEVALATAGGWHAIDLGPRILRVETAAVLLVAMLMHGLPPA